jgi:NAD(P)H-dependent FMN reductase
MDAAPLRILGVVGSLNQKSVTRLVVNYAIQAFVPKGCAVDVFDPLKEHLDLFNPDSAYSSSAYSLLQKRVEAADVLIVGTPDYHGSISSVLKNFLDHFWCEFAGKLFVSIVSSHEKGLTVTDQIRTVARQCYAWSLPYGISFLDKEDVKDGQVTSDSLKQRIEMMVCDTWHYGSLIARQRRLDLASNYPCFMARHRTPEP